MLPATADTPYTELIADKSAADRRRQHRWTNPGGSALTVGVAWPSLNADYMRSGIAHTETSAGIIHEVFTDADPSGPALCTLEIPAGGFLFVGGQGPAVYAASSATLTEIDLTDAGTPEGDARHPSSAALVTQAASVMGGAPSVPVGDFDTNPESTEPLPWEADLISYAAWILDNGQDQTTGGHKAAETGGAYVSNRGWGAAFGWADTLAAAHTIDRSANPYFGQIAERTRAMLLWECSRLMNSGLPQHWGSGNYTGQLGLSASNMVPYRSIEAMWSGLTGVQQDLVRSAMRVMGHANAVMPLETAANQSFHFLANLTGFIRAWRFIRDGEADAGMYDALLPEMIRVMTTRTGFVLGTAGEGRAISDIYGFDRSYSGLQASNVRHAYRAIAGIEDLSDTTDGLMGLYEDLERFFEPMLGTVDGTIRCSNAASSRKLEPTPQYGIKDDLRGVTGLISRYGSLGTDAIDIDPREPEFGRTYIYQRLAILDAYPFEGEQEAAPLPSTLATPGQSHNGATGWVRTPNYFAGFCSVAVTAAGTVNGGAGGPDVGEADEPGGPLSASIENEGASYVSALGADGGILAGQGGLESLSVGGVMALHTRNISPLTVHGVYGDDGVRYYTADPHSQDSAWDAEAKTLTTEFSLYGLAGTFTRVLDLSDDFRVAISLTAPADPGGGVTLTEVIPLLKPETTPLVKPTGFDFDPETVLGLPEEEGSRIGRMSIAVGWGETIEYSLQARAAESNQSRQVRVGRRRRRGGRSRRRRTM